MISGYMKRQKPREISYKDFSEIEEAVEYLLSTDLNTDETFRILRILRELKYISEIINTFFEQDSPRNSVIQLLYLHYCLKQFIQIKSKLNKCKEKILYDTNVSNLLNETNNLVRKVEVRIRDEKFNF